MAKLDGVLNVSDDVIEYEGSRYREVTSAIQVGDIARQEDVSAPRYKAHGEFFLITHLDSDGDGVFYDNDGDSDYIDETLHREWTLFRREVVALSTAQLVERKRAELAELEALLVEESTLRVGDYARVTVAGNSDVVVSIGDIVRIDQIDLRDNERPYKAYRMLGGRPGWDLIRAAERLTPAEARAALIAQIDELFAQREAAV
jgi:hypothetical protein